MTRNIPGHGFHCAESEYHLRRAALIYIPVLYILNVFPFCYSRSPTREETTMQNVSPSAPSEPDDPPISILKRIVRLAVRACRSDWAAVYVDASALATAEAPGLPPAQHMFSDLAWPPESSASWGLPSELHTVEDLDLLDAALPPHAPRFLVATPLQGLPNATLCIASAEARLPDEELHATLADLAKLASESVTPLDLKVDPKGRSGQRALPAPARTVYKTGPELRSLQKQSDEALSRSLAFIEWDRSGKVTDWNEAATEIFEYSRSEAMSLSVLDIVAPEYREHVRSVWDRQFSQEGGFFSHNANLTKSGKRIICEWHNTPLVNGDGEVFGVISLVQDVTLREQHARAIRESKEFAENLIVSVQDGVIVFDHTGTTIQVNDAFCLMTGFDRDDLLGTTLPYPFWPPEEYEALCVAFDTSISADVTRERVLQKKDGTRFPVAVHHSPMRNRAGNLVSVVATVHDLSEQKAAERGLAHEQELMEKIFGAIPVMIIVHDAENALLRVNQAFEEIVGRGTAHLPNMRVELDVEARMMMRSFIDALPREWTDITVTRPDETVVESSWIGIRSSGGTRLGIGIDVTDRTRRAEALESARDEAQKMNRLKTAFLANMSHEIRTPLTSILGFSEAIRASLEQPEVSVKALADAVDFVVQIENGGRRLLNTLNAVLDLSRLESGSMSLDIRPVSVAPLMQSVISSLGARMEVEMHASAVQVHTDEMALRTVLSHVIGNAVKFTPPSGIVRCQAERMAPGVEIRVEDTGIGIEADFLPRIFQPFMQESSGRGRSHEGNGLGLAVTYRLLELMGGTIDVQSEKGRGTCVTIHLPGA